MDTLLNVLGDGDGTKATAIVKSITYTVIQCLHDNDGPEPYRSWIHWDSNDNVRHHDFNFETVAFFNPEEPVWQKHRKDTAMESKKQQVQRADWVTVGSSKIVGCVKRVASDNTWADVDWHTHTKRMQASVLTIQTTINIGNGWEVTDGTREKELEQA